MVERMRALGWRDDRAGHAHQARVGAVRAHWTRAPRNSSLRREVLS